VNIKRAQQLSFNIAPHVNHLYRGDCLGVLDQIDDESIDLVYIDPPFFSQRYYETIWGEGSERHAFEDRWKGGIETFLGYLTERIKKLHAKLKPTGTMYVHLDWHICHYIKIEMDKIFGYNNFLNEIIWCYNVGGKSKRQWARKHDTILFYAKTKNWFFDGLAAGIKRETGTKSFGGKMGVDKDGRKYQDKLVKASGKYYRYYLDTPKIPEDWWVGINSIQSQSSERLGYPTQKPLELLDRIVKASCPPDGVVLDAFCGCGTTLEAAQLLGRRFIGIDISQSALRVVDNRLRKIGAPPAELHGMIETEGELRKLTWREFQTWAVGAVQGKHSPRKVADMGIDGFTFLENHPIQVKQTEAIGRPVVDNFVGVLEREKDKRGVIIGFNFTKGAFKEVARLKREQGKDIELITCKQLIKEEIPYRKIA
jgi:DNA modification methylase